MIVNKGICSFYQLLAGTTKLIHRAFHRVLRTVSVYLVFCCMASLVVFPCEGGEIKHEGIFAKNRIIVKVNKDIPEAQMQKNLKHSGEWTSQIIFSRSAGNRSQKSDTTLTGEKFIRIIFPSEVNIQKMIHVLNSYAWVDYAEPDYRIKAVVMPDDAMFSYQWAHKKIKSESGWDLETGKSDVVISVLDTGIDYHHSDLKGNLWKNSSEDWFGSTPGHNGIDDDGNGYVDDYYGMNALFQNGNILDDNGHGTSVAGIAAASGNNAIGVCGLNWNSDIMALKILDSKAVGNVSDAIKAIDYALRIKSRDGVKMIFNLSWGGYDYSQALKDVIDSAYFSSGVLFVAAAGNDAFNSEMNPMYPASYDSVNVISVAASDVYDQLASFSNYGMTKVHVAAPGVNLLTTKSGNSFFSISGTSGAVPHVSGLAALLLSKEPFLTGVMVKDRILETVDRIENLSGKVKTGGRINVYEALKSESVFTFNFSIHEGWNLVSLPVNPADTDIFDILGDAVDNIENIWTNRDGNWQVLLSDMPEASDLMTMETGYGYWIKALQNTSFDITGSPTYTPLELTSGWHLIGVNSPENIPVNEYLRDYEGHYESVWTFTGGTWMVYMPDSRGDSDFTVMESGKGYWVKMK